MKRINELEQERAAKVEEMTNLANKAAEEKRAKTEDEATRFSALKDEIKSVDTEIEDLKEVERLNKENGVEKKSETNEKRSAVEEFRTFLAGNDKEYRADFTTTTNTDLIEKTVDKVHTISSTSKDFLLNTLGVTYYTDKTGNFVLPYSDDSLASMPAEGADASTFVYNQGDNILAPKRFSATYTVSLESTENVGESTIVDILTKLQDSIWNKVEDYYYDQFVVDASGRHIDISTNHWANALELEEKAEGEVYIAPKTIKSTLKGAKIDAGSGRMVWEGNEMNGYPAYGRRYANSGQLLYFDPKETAIAQFGPLKVIKDETTNAKKGEIIFTAVGMFDAGISNPYCVAFAEGVA